MRPVYITNDAVEISATVTGSNPSKVQYSFDDPFATYATDYNTNGTWIDCGSPLASITTGTASTFLVNSSTGTGPARAVRLNTGTHSSGSVAMTVIQSGIA